MLVIVKNAPDTTDGRRGIQVAMDIAADLVLLQNGVYFARTERPEGFRGAAYVLDDDARLRGLREREMRKDIMRLDYGGLIDLMAKADKVVGMF
jgi:sulfur relay protein TusB/DsrH